MKNTTLLAVAVVGLLSSRIVQAQTPNQLTPSEERGGWKLLFDGKSTDGWRSYKQDKISDGWVVEDGALVRKDGAGDIVTTEQYDNFELLLDYKISPGGNSGLMFRVKETADTPWQTGPEIQIQDNKEGHDPQKAGWLYQLYRPGPDQFTGEDVDATRPAGEWNQLYVRITDNDSAIFLNGLQYAQFKIGSPDWNRRVAESKFAEFEGFGKAKKGYISLQDHGNAVAFRNIKIREVSENGDAPNPVDGELPFKAVKTFTNLKWADWEPVDDKGRPEAFRPILVTHAPGHDDRLIVGEQHGEIWSFENRADVTESKKLLSIRDKVQYSDRQNEEGLLGLAFHPKFAENGYFYVYYTARPGQISVISRFTVSKDDPMTADPASEVELMRIEEPFWNHNGGTIEFGPDGYLYICLGDGGAGNDPHRNGQNLGTLLGSILRIDVDQKSDGKAYSIPQDNPFVDTEGAQPEIYAYGIRNIWRFAHDRKTGDLWAGEVGQNLWEEIDIIVKGGNYGWNLDEGTHPFGSEGVTDQNVIAPIWEYDHQIGKSITGGLVYRGQKFPELDGKYLYADYVSGQVWALTYDIAGGKLVSNESIESEKLPIITFGDDAQGEVYFCIVAPDGKGIYTLEKK